MATFTCTWRLRFDRNSLTDSQSYEKSWDAAAVDPAIPERVKRQLEADRTGEFANVRLAFVVTYP